MFVAAITGRPIVSLLQKIAAKLNVGEEVRQGVSYESHFFTDAQQHLGTMYTSVGVQPNAQITFEKPIKEPDILRLKLHMAQSSPIHFGMDLKMKEGATDYSLETANHFVSGGQSESHSIEMRTQEDSDLLEREISGALTQSNLESIYWDLAG